MKYQKLVAWEFNATLWAQEMARLKDEMGAEFIAEMMGVSPSCIKNWANNVYTTGYEWPRMKNFIEACDQLDLDPTDFFHQVDVV